MRHNTKLHEKAAADIWRRASEIIHLANDPVLRQVLSARDRKGILKHRANVFYRKLMRTLRALDKMYRWDKSHAYPGMTLAGGLLNCEPLYNFFYRDLPSLLNH